MYSRNPFIYKITLIFIYINVFCYRTNVFVGGSFFPIYILLAHEIYSKRKSISVIFTK